MTTSESPTEQLAGWIERLHFDHLPADVVRLAKACILDTVGCALAGIGTPEGKALVRFAEALGGGGGAGIWGSGLSTTPPVAALANGTTAHAMELDDIGCGGHAGAVQVPAILALAALGRASGRDVITALVAGHEVSSRLADAGGYETYTLRGWHTTGICGSVAASAAGAKLLGLDRDRIAWALGVAGSFTGGVWAFMADGAMSKRLHAGKAAETGVTAALLAREGFTGPRHVLDAAWGGLLPSVLPGAHDLGQVTDGLGSDYRIRRKGFKRFPACWGVFSALDGVLALRAGHGFRATDVEWIRITLSEMSLRMLGRREIRTPVDAQMSLAYNLAVALTRGEGALVQQAGVVLTDGDVGEMIRRIELVVDPAEHGEVQTVQVQLRGGATLSTRVETPRGHARNPLTDAELREKFLALGGPTLSPDRAGLVVQAVHGLETLADVGQLLGLLAGR